MDNTQPTPFDNMTCTRELQMMKTMVPYMKESQKKQFAILIKYMELQNTIQVFSQKDKVLSMYAKGLSQRDIAHDACHVK